MTLNDVVIIDVNSRSGPRLSLGSGAPDDSISLINEVLQNMCSSVDFVYVQSLRGKTKRIASRI